MFGDNFTIYKTVKLSASVFPYTANTPFPLFDLAPVVAETTANRAFWKGYVKHRLFHLDPPLATEITIGSTPASWWPRTWGIFAQSKGFRLAKRFP